MLEQSVCGFGASGRNGGWASALLSARATRPSSRATDATPSRHLRNELQTQRRARLVRRPRDDGIDADFVHGGTLFFARSELQATRLRRRRRGVARARLRRRGPSVARARRRRLNARASPAPSARRSRPTAHGSIPRDWCAASPTSSNASAVTDLREHEGHAHRGSPPRITRPEVVTRRGQRARSLRRARHRGVHARRSPGERRSVAPLYSLMIASEPQSDDFWDEVGLRHYETFADDRHVIIYGQRTDDGRFAFGGRGAPYHFGSTVEPRFDQNPKVFGLLEADPARALPSLEGDITHRWGGPLAHVARSVTLGRRRPRERARECRRATPAMASS